MNGEYSVTLFINVCKFTATADWLKIQGVSLYVRCAKKKKL